MLLIKRIRVKDDVLWAAGAAIAKAQGHTISWLLMDLLRKHVEMKQRSARREAYMKTLYEEGCTAREVLGIIRERDKAGSWDEPEVQG